MTDFSLRKTCAAGVTALAMVLTPAAPAQAGSIDEDQLSQLLFGAVALGIVGYALRDAEAKGTQQGGARITTQLGQHQPQGRRYEESDVRNPSTQRQPDRNRGNRWQEPRRFAPVPAQCLRRVTTPQGVQRVYGGRCLRNTYADANRLPNQCRVSIGAHRRGYDPQCLRGYGFRRAQR